MQSPPRTLTVVFLLLLLLPLCLASDSPSAYEMLGKFNFPKGILPEGVKSYRLHPDGSFEVLLSGDCEFRVDGDGYLLKYRERITGKVRSGHLMDLNGVNVKVLLVWFGINEVVRSGTELYFYVGPLSASYPSANFEECPKCLCGSSCASASIAATGAGNSVVDS